MKIPDILTQKEVLELTGFKKSSLYNYIHVDNFPEPKKMGVRSARWSKKEVLAWVKKKGFDISDVK